MTAARAWEVHVDWARCAGHGVCSAALGERLGLDPWGYPVEVARGPVPARLEEAARLAVASCPAAALALRRVGAK